MNLIFVLLFEYQILVMSCIQRECINQKTVDNPVVSQPEQKSMGQIFTAHFNGNNNVLFVQILNTVRNIGVQHADIPLGHFDLMSVNDLNAGTGIHINKFDHSMNVFWNIGEARLLVDTYQFVRQKAIEGKKIYLPVMEMNPGYSLITFGQNSGTCHLVLPFRISILKQIIV
ncbi:hypothetical protein AALB39_19720 [Lachnospiraceae bacterium 54-53]